MVSGHGEIGDEIANLFPPGLSEGQFSLPMIIPFGVFALVLIAVPVHGGLNPGFGGGGTEAEIVDSFGEVVDVGEGTGQGGRVLAELGVEDRLGHVGDFGFMASGFPDEVGPAFVGEDFLGCNMAGLVGGFGSVDGADEVVCCIGCVEGAKGGAVLQGEDKIAAVQSALYPPPHPARGVVPAHDSGNAYDGVGDFAVFLEPFFAVSFAHAIGKFAFRIGVVQRGPFYV